eukprot:gene14146-18984_t
MVSLVILLIFLIPCVVGLAGGPIRGDKLPKILSLLQSSDMGLLTSNNNEIVQLIDTIALENQGRRQNDKELLDGNWELLWTTEKETLFFLKNGLFGFGGVKNIVQTIDVKNTNTIINCINFSNSNYFSVVGDVFEDESGLFQNRLNFKFTSATIKISSLKLNLPPFGQGWFDNIYVNNKYRLSRDIRGDYLISQKM